MSNLCFFARTDSTGCGMLSPLHFDTDQQNTMTGCMFNPYCAREDLIDPFNIAYIILTLKKNQRVFVNSCPQTWCTFCCSFKTLTTAFRLSFRITIVIIFTEFDKVI